VKPDIFRQYTLAAPKIQYSLYNSNVKYTYLSTFLPGTALIVEQALSASIKDVEIDLTLNGAIVYQTETNFQNLINLDFFNNTFVLLKKFEVKKDYDIFDTMLMWCNTHDLSNINAFTKKLGVHTFRLRLVKANEFIRYDVRKISFTEDKIAKDLRLKTNRLLPESEVWLMERSEGFGFVLFRITNEPKNSQKLPGQLKPELASMMCIYSEPSLNDVVLDPFAGYGTILTERIKFPFKKVIGLDKEGRINANIIVEISKEDLFENTLEKESITKIITDPPWGEFDTTIDIPYFYSHMFKEFKRILEPNGMIVLLVSRDIDITYYLQENCFVIIDQLDILVSGKKATLYKILN